jgi:2-hydroxyglutarate dehydrogenase
MGSLGQTGRLSAGEKQVLRLAPDERATSAAPARCDVVVVGAGIIGLAVARELCAHHPSVSVCVLERERTIGTHQTGHNSGVIHSGVYYAPGSLKAKLCVQGADELYRYCESHGIQMQRCGKLIVALSRSELPALREMHRRGAANGVRGLRMLAAEEITEIEPHATGVAALHCPQTGVVDFAAVARAYAADVLTAGGSIATGCEVTRADGLGHSVEVEHSHGRTHARYAIFCAGAWSDRLALRSGADADPRIVPFRGAYLRLRTDRDNLVRGLIYPVPDPRLPFLGVHLTRTIDGRVLLGPTALPAGARDAYRLTRLRRRDLIDTLRWRGTWRMVARFWRTAAAEVTQALVPGAIVRAGARYVPELGSADVEPAFAGVRAQAVGRDGVLIDDFAFSTTHRILHVRNAPSPAATSSLAIARHVVEVARQAGLELPG